MAQVSAHTSLVHQLVIAVLPLIIASIAAVPTSVRAQTTTAASSIVRGVVADALDGTPLPQAAVVLRQPGSTTMYADTTSDMEGRYVLSDLDSGRYTLFVSYVGYAEYRFDVVLREGSTRTINVALEPAAEVLDPVVVTVGIPLRWVGWVFAKEIELKDKIENVGAQMVG